MNHNGAFMSSSVLKLRLEQSLKDEANLLAKSMGFTISDAVRMFLIKFVDEQKIPFEISIPNKETIRAIMDAENGNTIKVESFSGLIEEIDKELAEECSKQG